MKTPLVSIVTPCYNGEKFIHRFLNSVLNQSYENIELLFVNDGSTDRTEEIILSYKEKFSKKKIPLKYIFQKNNGQASALNRALGIFQGEYLTWPDSDDILHRDNIAKKVDFLEKHSDCGMVLCKSRVLNENNLEPIGEMKRVVTDKDDLFFDLIVERNVYYAPGGYMVRASCFLDVIPTRQIFEGSGGQNWQMLLPIAYKYKCGYIDEHLYDYVLRINSHSHNIQNIEDSFRRIDEHVCLLNAVIKGIIGMGERDKQYYIEVVRHKYAHKRLSVATQYKEKNTIQRCYNDLKREGLVTGQDRIYYLCGKYFLFRYGYNFTKKLFKWITMLKKVHP